MANLKFIVPSLGEFQLVAYKTETSSDSIQLYAIKNPAGQKVGVAQSHFLPHEKGKKQASLLIFLRSQFHRVEILTHVVESLTTQAFTNLDCDRVAVPNFLEEDALTQALNNCGFSSSGRRDFVHTQESWGLFSISKIILKEKHNLLPSSADLTDGLMNRVAALWYSNFSKGIDLSEGGIDRSFITLAQLAQNPNLQTFSLYRSDRNSVWLTDDAMKRFLTEEGALTHATKTNSLKTIFCYGSHEGIVRVARCIYNEKYNNGIFWPQGSYALLAAALKGMAPVGYQIHLVGVDPKRGEKISLRSLEEFFQAYPQAKTFFLELKSMAGAVYSKEELRELIVLCKKYGVFVLGDATHHNTHFSKEAEFVDIVSIFQSINYHEYVVVYTASKTYGLERGRVGFIVLSEFIQSLSPDFLLVDLYRNIGAGFDLPYELANALINSPVEKRQQFVSECQNTLRRNMNLMLGYIEGSKSPNVDRDLSSEVASAIPTEYHQGIKGISLVVKPQAGAQLKIHVQGLRNLFFFNIQMFNSEIFCYALHKVMGVVTLHSYCFLNLDPFLMRLSFSFREDVHQGMCRISDFVGLLTDVPKMNRHMPEIHDAKKFLEDSLRAESKHNETDAVFTTTSKDVVLFKQVTDEKTKSKGPAGVHHLLRSGL